MGRTLKSTYFIIRKKLNRYSLFAGNIWYALANGWLPVIDMQNYPDSYLPPEKLGKENSWEYYFEQLLRIGLEQAYGGENIILSSAINMQPRPSFYLSFFQNHNNILTRWKVLVELGLLKVKPAIIEQIMLIRQKLFSKNDRVLGVLLRGTDYVANKPKGHPIPPPIELALGTVLAKIQEWGCNKIFLATEDKRIISDFKNVFGDFCVILDREYVDYKNGGHISLCRIDRENDRLWQGAEYLAQILILSKCNSFIAARCGGTTGVMMMSGGFEHTYFFNLGRYGAITLD